MVVTEVARGRTVMLQFNGGGMVLIEVDSISYL